MIPASSPRNDFTQAMPEAWGESKMFAQRERRWLLPSLDLTDGDGFTRRRNELAQKWQKARL
jgi:hypothetical protein